MKRTAIMFVILSIFIFTGCKNNDSEQTVVQIELDNVEIDTIQYYMSKDSKYIYPFWGWIKEAVDSAGTVTIKLENSSLNQLLINVIKDTLYLPIKLLVQPAQEFILKVDPISDELLTISGPSSEGQYFLSMLERYVIYGGSTEEYASDTVPSKLFEILKGEIRKELMPFKLLFEDGKIDGEFYSVVKADIECYNAYKLITTLASKHIIAERIARGGYCIPSYMKKLRPLDSTYFALMDTIFTSYPFDRPEVWLSTQLDHHLGSYVWYKFSSDTSFNHLNDDYERTRQIARKYLESEYYEYFYASSIVSFVTDLESMQMKYDSFKSEFPASFYSDGIETNIAMIKAMFNR